MSSVTPITILCPDLCPSVWSYFKQSASFYTQWMLEKAKPSIIIITSPSVLTYLDDILNNLSNDEDSDNNEEVDDDSEDEMEEEELADIQKLANEEEEIEKKLKTSEDRLADKLGDSINKPVSDSEDKKEDIADDDAEAENFFSDEETLVTQVEVKCVNEYITPEDKKTEIGVTKKTKQTKKKRQLSTGKTQTKTKTIITNVTSVKSEVKELLCSLEQ